MVSAAVDAVDAMDAVDAVDAITGTVSQLTHAHTPYSAEWAAAFLARRAAKN